MKYKVLVCREVWGTIEVEADSALSAELKVIDGDYESEFVPTGKIGNEGCYRAELVAEGHRNDRTT